jgi:isopenicillin-N N-acyltransferase like protein
MTRGCPDPHPEVGPAYHRILNYHAAQDISYMLMNSPLLRGGCTGLAAWGDQVANGHLLVARNFDWEPAPVFDKERVLIICEPGEGIPFVSLAWAGMAGCVSAMNREGLAVFVNGAPSELPGDTAAPTCFVARDVVQHARTIAEATAILGRYQVFVSAMFLVASREDGRAVVIEKTPNQMTVREPVGTPWIICANHYMTVALTNTAVNQKYVQVDTSLSRYARMSELLRREAGHLDVSHTAALLRDRLLPGDRMAGNGHRGALNPLIATHAVVMDLTGGIFWAARTPHQLGRFIAFDLSDPEKSLPEQAVPEDPMLTGGYEDYLGAKTSLDNGWRALRKGDLDQAIVCTESAEHGNPGFYGNTWLRAEALFQQGKRPETAQACRVALERSPALAGERRRIEQLLRRAEAQK